MGALILPARIFGGLLGIVGAGNVVCFVLLMISGAMLTGWAISGVVLLAAWFGIYLWLRKISAIVGGPRPSLFVAGFGLGVGLWVLVPAIEHARDNARMMMCGNQLKQVRVIVADLQARHDGHFPSSTGREFLLEVQRETRMDERLLMCPADGTPYRGPTRNVNTMHEGQIMLACQSPAHTHGSTALAVEISGAVTRGRRGDDIFRRIEQETTSEQGVRR